MNCGGPNGDVQFGTVARTVCLCAPTRLTAILSGLVERQDLGYEQAVAAVNGVVVAVGGSFGEGLGCAMAPTTAVGFIDLPPGEHRVELFASTVDGNFHVGAFWNFNLIWEPL